MIVIVIAIVVPRGGRSPDIEKVAKYDTIRYDTVRTMWMVK